jgi:hypothetical protein
VIGHVAADPLPSGGRRPRPLIEDGPPTTTVFEIDCYEIPRAADEVETKALDAGDLGVDSNMVVPEEADPRTRASDHLG